MIKRAVPHPEQDARVFPPRLINGLFSAEHALLIEPRDDLGTLGLRPDGAAAHAARRVPRHGREQVLHQPVHVGLEMLRRLRGGMLRRGGLLGGRVVWEVVAVDKVVRCTSRRMVSLTSWKRLSSKLTHKKPHELSAVLDEHRARTERFSVG